jgi:hypothetical protein
VVLVGHFGFVVEKFDNIDIVVVVVVVVVVVEAEVAVAAEALSEKAESPAVLPVVTVGQEAVVVV